MSLAAFGLLLAAVAGLLSAFMGQAYMTSQWATVHVFGTAVDLSTPMFFDIGVYLVVVGAIGSIALALEERESDRWKLDCPSSSACSSPWPFI